ncbi:hypothetical protein NG99_21075 [Erwinia typographi]|uniref:Fimbrial-type adhesion domain-containing protein n=1 Tax=Erwinia typographi TaxID=371042 RepID=A0A0A3YQ53_9GAMM|nr:fimbrial protein [Erwinia typographi]KGT88760.1 hypothetical protein NG99_21075 [Erwinia typographi]
MNMKRRAVSAMALTVLLAAGLNAQAQAASAEAFITIKGKVLSNTCTLESKNINVAMAAISDKDIRKKGETAAKRTVSLVLKDCGGAVSAVKVTAQGTADDDDKSAFANLYGNGKDETKTAATGLGIHFYETDGNTLFNPDNPVTETSTLTPDEDNTLTYTAEYVGTKDTVTGGNFSTVINMTLDYQ